MKLLFDEQLSPRLVRALSDVFPDSAHVESVGLERADDESIWRYAAAHGFVIASKDADFAELAVFRRGVPKVLWIRRGNCTTNEIENLLRQHAEEIVAFASGESALLPLL